MSPLLLVTLLVAGLLALLPVWRLHAAAWPTRWLLGAWVLYAAAIVVLIRFPTAARFLVPILVFAFVAPFIAGPQRLSRMVRVRRREPGVIIDVTPRLPSLPDPDDVDGEPDDDRSR